MPINQSQEISKKHKSHKKKQSGKLTENKRLKHNFGKWKIGDFVVPNLTKKIKLTLKGQQKAVTTRCRIICAAKPRKSQKLEAPEMKIGIM